MLLNSGLTQRCVYLVDVGQRKREQTNQHRGRTLKIERDRRLAQYIETMILEHKYFPDVVIGRMKAEELVFETSICTKTLYTYIEKGIFAEISNKNLWVKRHKKKRNYQKIRRVSLNNLKGKSISDRPAEVDTRQEQGYRELTLLWANKEQNQLY